MTVMYMIFVVDNAMHSLAVYSSWYEIYIHCILHIYTNLFIIFNNLFVLTDKRHISYDLFVATLLFVYLSSHNSFFCYSAPIVPKYLSTEVTLRHINFVDTRKRWITKEYKRKSLRMRTYIRNIPIINIIQKTGQISRRTALTTLRTLFRYSTST